LSSAPSIRSIFIDKLLKSTREEIMAGYGAIDHDVKHDSTVVTEIDQSIERQITDALLAEYPDIGIHGEEFGKQGNAETYWLIDPIDGTENFVRGLPGITTIIGLMSGGEAVEAYVYDIVNDIVYSAAKGKGAYADTVPIHASVRTVDRATISIGNTITHQYPEISQALKSVGVDYIGMHHGSGIKAIYIAAGKIEGCVYMHNRGGDWDHLPTQLLMTEAGNIVTPLGDSEPGAWKYTILAPSVHEQCVSAIKRAANE